jgi:hypothetical protein
MSAAMTAAQARAEYADKPMQQHLRHMVRAWQERLSGSYIAASPVAFLVMFIDGPVVASIRKHTLLNMKRARRARNEQPDQDSDSFTNVVFGTFLHTWLLCALHRMPFDLQLYFCKPKLSGDRYRHIMKHLSAFDIGHDDDEGALWTERRDFAPRVSDFQTTLAATNRPLLIGSFRKALLSLDDDLFRYVVYTDSSVAVWLTGVARMVHADTAGVKASMCTWKGVSKPKAKA